MHGGCGAGLCFHTWEMSESGFHLCPSNRLNQDYFKAYLQLFQPHPRGKCLVFSECGNEKTEKWLKNTFALYSVTGGENSEFLILSENKPCFINQTEVLYQSMMMVWDEYLKS